MIYKILIGILLLFPIQAFAGSISLSGAKYGGETSGYDITGKVQDQAGAIDFYAEYKYGEIDDVVSRDQGEIGIGYDPVINQDWSLWFDYVVGYNKIWDINFESMIGLGPKYYLVKNDKRSASFSTGILYHYQSGDEEGRGRYSHRLKYGDKWFSGVYFYQPNMRDTRDYITIGEASISLTEIVSLYYKDEYRSLDGLRSTETGIKITIKFKTEKEEIK